MPLPVWHLVALSRRCLCCVKFVSPWSWMTISLRLACKLLEILKVALDSKVSHNFAWQCRYLLCVEIMIFWTWTAEASCFFLLRSDLMIYLSRFCRCSSLGAASKSTCRTVLARSHIIWLDLAGISAVWRWWVLALEQCLSLSLWLVRSSWPGEGHSCNACFLSPVCVWWLPQ